MYHIGILQGEASIFQFDGSKNLLSHPITTETLSRDMILRSSAAHPSPANPLIGNQFHSTHLLCTSTAHACIHHKVTISLVRQPASFTLPQPHCIGHNPPRHTHTHTHRYSTGNALSIHLIRFSYFKRSTHTVLYPATL